MSWTILDFPFLGTGVPSELGMLSGVINNVPADGSGSVVLSYAAKFATLSSAPVLGIITPVPGRDELSVQASAVTNLGFTVTVTGGQPGSFVSVAWSATGL